jgi:hypothetical protein
MRREFRPGHGVRQALLTHDGGDLDRRRGPQERQRVVHGPRGASATA